MPATFTANIISVTETFLANQPAVSLGATAGHATLAVGVDRR